MTEFIKIARLDDIPPGGRLWYDFAEETVVVFNVGGTLYCLADRCTHDDGPLEDGELEDHQIECPRHGARFDIRTGKALCLPATSPVPTFAVKVADGDVYVESPDIW
ncbi:MAG: non-heme iron oxygenase ferredoxin subunit [Chloroflexi bacterium]|nr:non-heme iron oxygenase ferredoxin subunit [Chloroflexota bacterium]MBK7175929.1 non-heme iron oxygenase ferredoxin subunit [Chloroflexota bacterium]MBK7914685.1 non-heme iron oxygenase ferredoxin subunit [Chloroflexota bacterium]MBK8934484.1 non-heme iron oxygenase ferredoxin subunit [Chloroflexota bacterium]MBP6803890.1 non-heme iron oxygenase ferredoxin subunit [Chloroflexota bacterium]